jgi:hypothetical protein
MQVKPLYRRVHSQHHEIGSAITALGTAFGDAVDIGLCFTAFHLALVFYLTLLNRWNLAAFLILISFEVSMTLPPLPMLHGAADLHTIAEPHQLLCCSGGTDL